MSDHAPAFGTSIAYPLDAEGAMRLVRASLLCVGGTASSPRITTSDLASGPKDAVLVLGAFDGLHRGHRALVAAAMADAQVRGVPCVAVTFSPDPSEVLHPESPQPRLLSPEDRIAGLAHLGVDATVSLPFDRSLAALSPDEFVARVLMATVTPQSVHVGTNFHFGRGGTGTAETLREIGSQAGFEVVESPLVTSGGQRVSSTRIRHLLDTPGGLDEANALLARSHFVRGVIEHGRGEGTSFGFPTANIRCDGRTCMPCTGVYGGYVTIDGTAWPAAINVGAPPSFSGPDEFFLEANLIGFSGDVYGSHASVSFVEWLRPSRRFESLDELERVVLDDIAWVRENLGEGGVRL